jgi:nucleoside-triphosphatase THEP1
MPEPKIVLLTGERQVGKTTVCLRLVEALRQTTLDVAGLLTRRTGPCALEVLELRTDQAYPLTAPAENEQGIVVGKFRMRPDAMARSRKALDTSFPTQVFLLDEIGPLELVRGEGWVRAMTLLKRRSYLIAFIVVRPELLVPAICQLPASFYTVVRVTHKNRDMLPASLRNIAIEACTLTSEQP